MTYSITHCTSDWISESFTRQDNSVFVFLFFFFITTGCSLAVQGPCDSLAVSLIWFVLSAKKKNGALTSWQVPGNQMSVLIKVAAANILDNSDNNNNRNFYSLQRTEVTAVTLKRQDLPEPLFDTTFRQWTTTAWSRIRSGMGAFIFHQSYKKTKACIITLHRGKLWIHWNHPKHQKKKK